MVCTVDACEKPVHARGYCRFAPGDEIGYGTAHERVRATRGSARDQVCVDCGSPAAEWSYDHNDPNEKIVFRGRYQVAYSVDPTHYQPRCLSCHRSSDRSREK